WAAEGSYSSVVVELLRFTQTNLDMKKSHNRTLLSRAAEKGWEAIVRLFRRKAQVKLNPEIRHERTDISLAARSELAVMLPTSRHIDFDSKDNQDRTPLCWAAFHGHEHIVSLLLGTGTAFPIVQDNSGRAPISYAAESQRDAIVAKLPNNSTFDPDSTAQQGRTASHWVTEGGSIASNSWLLHDKRLFPDRRNIAGDSPLSIAYRLSTFDAASAIMYTSKASITLTGGSQYQDLISRATENHETV
ncbi:ankyrin repeat-containing domain protein, partial [Delphinella strobiligena]